MQTIETSMAHTPINDWDEAQRIYFHDADHDALHRISQQARESVPPNTTVIAAIAAVSLRETIPSKPDCLRSVLFDEMYKVAADAL